MSFDILLILTWIKEDTNRFRNHHFKIETAVYKTMQYYKYNKYRVAALQSNKKTVKPYFVSLSILYHHRLYGVN